MYPITSLHGVTTQKTASRIISSLRSNP